MNYERFVFNFSSDSTRKEQFAGEDYVVVPMAMLGEGVYEGSAGPLLYLQEELKRAPNLWNMRPITLSHPKINGEPKSGCDPMVFNEFGLGYVMNARYQRNKLRAEAWLNVRLCNELAPELLNNIESGSLVEVSTGLFSQNEMADGQWSDGRSYIGVVRNIQPDHLAVLLETRGAYSIADGGGLLQLNELKESGYNVQTILQDAIQIACQKHGINNAMSYGKVTGKVHQALVEKHGEESFWMEDVYADFVVFNKDNKMLKSNFTMEEDKVTLEDTIPIEVKRVTEYRTVDGAFIGNKDHSNFAVQTQSLKENNVDNSNFVAELIANEESPWTEEDREVLLSMPEKQLEKLISNSKEESSTEVNNREEVIVSPEETQVQVSNEQVSLEEYINNAPPEIQDVLTESIASNAKERKSLIDVIVANEKNTFTEDILTQKATGELRSIAALCNNETQAAESTESVGNVREQIANFAGRAAPANVSSVTNEEPLVAPEIDWSKR